MAYDTDGAPWIRDWGALLRTARQVAGWSLTELSARTGLSKGYLSKLESGHPSARNPSRATLAALARALPNFGTLAHVLEPGDAAPAIAAPGAAEEERAFARPDGWAAADPLRLTWRELEVLVVVLVLDQAASRQPLTSIVIARTLRRPAREVELTLGGLVERGLLRQSPPAFHGGSAAYNRTPQFAEMTGLNRIGDALLVSAALLTRATSVAEHVGDTGNEIAR